MLCICGFQVGLLGVEQAFLDVRRFDLADNETADALLEIVKQRNYIPESAKKEYKAALLAEHKKYFAKSS